MIDHLQMTVPLSQRKGAIELSERPSDRLEYLMGFGACRKCQSCFGFVTPNAGPAEQCSNCGHEFAVHW